MTQNGEEGLRLMQSHSYSFVLSVGHPDANDGRAGDGAADSVEITRRRKTKSRHNRDVCELRPRDARRVTGWHHSCCLCIVFVECMR